tara:strand:- start:150 stop:575 length:426 start_codon:yes stop_codon:yes gene_type:complete
MMVKSKDEIIKNNYQTLILGVTILTSMEEKEINEIGYSCNIKDQVSKMARLCYQSELNGVVCSVKEAKFIKSEFPENFLCVCPGIRNTENKSDDQKRIATPKLAAEYGADYIVVGRPVTKSDKPLESLMMIKKEFDESKII